MDRIPLTREGYEALNKELDRLKTVERPAVIQAIAEAREHGDLKENAEYHSAREKQSFLEGRITDLEHKLSLADVIDTAGMESSTVRFGAFVEIYDEQTEKEIKYRIVGEEESDIEQGKLSIKAPLAKAMLGKEAGDVVEVHSPGGVKSYEIISIKY